LFFILLPPFFQISFRVYFCRRKIFYSGRNLKNMVFKRTDIIRTFLLKAPLVKGGWFWLCQNRGDSVEITG